MSGICGIVDFRRAVQGRSVDAMIHAAEHRASHGSTSFVEQEVGLAHLASGRLPESSGVTQPVSDRGVVVVADARLDNRDELVPALLRARLLAGERPSDAEIILAAFLHWDSEAASHLIGDFAFVVWDGRTKRLFGGRDPMAMRSLYFRQEQGRLLFSTELKQILAVPDVPAQINEPAIADYLMGRFPIDSAAYEGIKPLPPGNTMLFDGSGLNVRTYWEFDPTAEITFPTEDEYAEKLLEVFERAVRDRLRNTGPVGILLSGGMDSGSVASTAGRLSPSGMSPPLHAYSWAFPTLTQCDERDVSRLITRHFGISEVDVDAEANHPLRDYPRHGPDRDEPFIGVYQPVIEASLAAAARDGVTVMLGGDRGDLLVGGFDVALTSLIKAGDTAVLRKEVSRLARLTGRSRSSIAIEFVLRPVLERIRRLGPIGAARKLGSRTTGVVEAHPNLPPWLGLEFASPVDRSDAAHTRAASPQAHPWALKRHEYVVEPMHMSGVRWSERTYARYGIGFADPFSDVRLAEYVMAIPQLALNRPGVVDKRLLRLAMSGVMPEEALSKARKVVPYPLWQRALRGSASATILDLLSNMEAATRGFVNEEGLVNHYRQIQAGAKEHSGFWWALSLEMWLRAYWT